MAFQKKVPKKICNRCFYLDKFCVQLAKTFPDKILEEKNMIR